MPAIRKNFSLKDHNSFGIDARTALYAAPENIEQLSDLFDHYDFKTQPYLVIGEGSNILFKDDFEGLVVNPGMRGVDLIEKKGEELLVRVGAAENWDQWVAHATQQGWFGLENLSLIPGSVGSAPVQNIGAYGVEFKDHFGWLEAWDLEQQKQVRLTGAQCRFGYRTSIFKAEYPGRYIITHVAFRLNKKPHLKLDYGPLKEALFSSRSPSPMELRKVIISIRQQKLPDPRDFGNAGSFFKNPLVARTIYESLKINFPEIPHFQDANGHFKIPAAWLIEKAGWKGKRIGNVGTWPKQPLVIVNYGGASGKEVVDFSERIRNVVEEKFGLLLEREVNVI